jgi:hypothetical protein
MPPGAFARGRKRADAEKGHPQRALPPHGVEIGPADLAEGQKRIEIEALGHRLFRELPKLDARPQRNLGNGSEHGLR